MQHLAVEQPAHGLQSDVRVRRDSHARPGRDVGGTVMVEETPRADRAQVMLRKQSPYLGSVADRGLARLDDVDRADDARSQLDLVRCSSKLLTSPGCHLHNGRSGDAAFASSVLVGTRGTILSGAERLEEGGICRAATV